jgi:hypothetical protein
VFHNPKTHSRRPGDTITESSLDVDQVPRSNSADSESDVSDETRSSIDDEDMYTVTSNPQVQHQTIFQPCLIHLCDLSPSCLDTVKRCKLNLIPILSICYRTGFRPQFEPSLDLATFSKSSTKDGSRTSLPVGTFSRPAPSRYFKAVQWRRSSESPITLKQCSGGGVVKALLL